MCCGLVCVCVCVRWILERWKRARTTRFRNDLCQCRRDWFGANRMEFQLLAFGPQTHENIQRTLFCLRTAYYAVASTLTIHKNSIDLNRAKERTNERRKRLKRKINLMTSVGRICATLTQFRCDWFGRVCVCFCVSRIHYHFAYLSNDR